MKKSLPFDFGGRSNAGISLAVDWFSAEVVVAAVAGEGTIDELYPRIERSDKQLSFCHQRDRT